MIGWRFLPLKTLRDEGYLQEVNRQFFHPLGLALAIITDGDNGARLSILDGRDDAEGFIFAPGDDLAASARRIKQIADARREARIKALGYWQQPVETGFDVQQQKETKTMSVCTVKIENLPTATANMALTVTTSGGPASFSYAPGDSGQFELIGGATASVDGATSPGAQLKVTNVGAREAQIVVDRAQPLFLTTGEVFTQDFVFGKAPYVVNIEAA